MGGLELEFSHLQRSVLTTTLWETPFLKCFSLPIRRRQKENFSIGALPIS